MSVRIWDSTSQSFVEAQNPMVYDQENQSWKNTKGLVYDATNQSWVEKWSPIKELIPIMTSLTKPYGTADGYYYGSNGSYRCFDGNVNSVGVSSDDGQHENVYLWCSYTFKSVVFLNKITLTWNIEYFNASKNYTALFQYRRSESSSWITAGNATRPSDRVMYNDTVEGINDIATSIRIYIETMKTYGTGPSLREVQAYGYYK